MEETPAQAWNSLLQGISIRNAPSGFGKFFSAYLPSGEAVGLPSNSKFTFSKMSYQSGPGLENTMITATQNTGAVYVCTCSEGTWSNWIPQQSAQTYVKLANPVAIYSQGSRNNVSGSFAIPIEYQGVLRNTMCMFRIAMFSNTGSGSIGASINTNNNMSLSSVDPPYPAISAFSADVYVSTVVPSSGIRAAQTTLLTSTDSNGNITLYVTRNAGDMASSIYISLIGYYR
jgi:hypothetical protein